MREHAKGRSHGLALLLAAVVVAGSGGCTAGDATAQAKGDPKATATPGTVAVPTQPYDIVLGDEIGLIEHARMLAQFTCLSKAGFPQDLRTMPARPTDPFAGLRVSASTFGPASDEAARRQGFGADSGGEPARIVSYDASYDAALDRCGRQADARLGADAKDTLAAYYDLVNKLAPYRGEVDTPDGVGAAMADCITKAGYRIRDRDAFVRGPNPRTLGVPFGSRATGSEEQWHPKEEPGTVQVGPAIPARKYTPTQQESDLAMKWRHCQQQTGMVDKLLAAAFAVQQRYVDKYESQFAELNPKIEALAKTAAALAAGK